MKNLSKELIELCQAVTGKRPKTVIDHILSHGHITTEELKNRYGYNHPPRAARDVREWGIPLVTFTVTGADGRKIAAYRFGDIESRKVQKFQGRTALSKKLKKELVEKFGNICFIYAEQMNESELQIDHRIPYEIVGDDKEAVADDFMLLCGSANRAKSWSCEQCDNWKVIKNPEICGKCYWAYPEGYEHIAMLPIRRLDLMWRGAETDTFDGVKKAAQKAGLKMPEYVKEIIKKAVGPNK